MNEATQPRPRVKLTGTDGNAFAVLGKCREAMRRAKCSPERIKEFTDKATSGDYDNLLATCAEYCDVR